MSIYEQATALAEDIIRDRRKIHSQPELGFETVQTAAYVMERLKEMGYEPTQISRNSVVATVGQGGKTILLRADMDALPMTELTGLDFASTNGNSHSCGHDAHTAMLLGAARLLKDQESSLKGTVKLMFQPAEELLTGAKEMIDAGVLKNPDVDCAMMCHVNSTAPRGVYIGSGPGTTASYNFRITVKGNGCHGAMPETGVDPVLTGAHILIGLQEILSREVSFPKGAVLTMGHFKAGSAPNIIPGEAILEGTMRTFDSETQAYVMTRISEIAAQIARTYRCEATVEDLSAVPVSLNDPQFTSDVIRYIEEIRGNEFEVYPAVPATGSEDFAWISQEVPSCMFSLSAPVEGSEILYPLHHPKMVLDESAFPIGSAIFAKCAIQWLEEHSQEA
ncbi:M20 family metallopeptidase [Proteiniclasticum sp. QWL-01]|uniref:M20 metallopeptidase family protein n=1 Tax=Proteiniclasticum sp. QWL-01 TaxID=3036945 RepID=UPI00240ECB1E|nr:M20 family metallopeptidase [Proteiniclasticum sp. QWL-01]WFF72938.1 M20 family metallopeptidase [Proteiniclasticum sp. QWL-01]